MQMYSHEIKRCISRNCLNHCVVATEYKIATFIEISMKEISYSHVVHLFFQVHPVNKIFNVARLPKSFFLLYPIIFVFTNP